jgi:release factor glutamine methyltransferase
LSSTYPHSTRSLLVEGAALLAATGGPSRLEAELLLAQAADCARTQLIAWPDEPVPSAVAETFRALVERRREGEPMAYIRGHQEFWSLELAVSRDTLIPRPETELLVELVLARLPPSPPLLVADAGTGCGAVAAALARERPAWTLVAIERSEAAARVARANLQRYAPENAWLLIGDWLTTVAPASLDALVSNPPYVPAADPHLAQGDLRFEPSAALRGGPDGLDAIRHLAREGASRIRAGGLLAIEHGYDQGARVRAILAVEGYVRIETHHDLAGQERVTLAGVAPPSRIAQAGNGSLQP